MNGFTCGFRIMDPAFRLQSWIAYLISSPGCAAPVSRVGSALDLHFAASPCRDMAVAFGWRASRARVPRSISLSRWQPLSNLPVPPTSYALQEQIVFHGCNCKKCLYRRSLSGCDPGRDHPAARSNPDRCAALAGRWAYLARLTDGHG